MRYRFADMTDACAARQADEIEALSAIYGEDWCVIDEEAHIYCIRISAQSHDTKWTLSLQIHVPGDYPVQSPPEFQLNAPWLRGAERTNLESKLAQIYCDNIGEDIIYLWVEAVREFLQNKADHAGGDASSSDWKSHQLPVQTQEADDADDGFDLSLLEGVLTSSLDDVEDKHEEYECPTIHHGEIVTDRRSTFQPHLAVVFFKQQVRQVLEKLRQSKKIANATHNMYAYRIVHHEGSMPRIFQGCDDDGETHAGSRMLHLLQIVNAENVMVVVSRWYGGIHLGPDRFKHINNCTRSILKSHGYLAQREEKKGPRSGKKRK